MAVNPTELLKNPFFFTQNIREVSRTKVGFPIAARSPLSKTLETISNDKLQMTNVFVRPAGF